MRNLANANDEATAHIKSGEELFLPERENSIGADLDCPQILQALVEERAPFVRAHLDAVDAASESGGGAGGALRAPTPPRCLRQHPPSRVG